jgi:hypothetical protein
MNTKYDLSNPSFQDHREMIDFNDNTFVYPDYADGWYIRKAKVAPDNNARNVLIDLKMRTIALDGRRETEMGLYLPLKTGYYPFENLFQKPEYITKKRKHEHLYRKYR